MDRRDALERLSRDHFDLLVVGGGITGCGIALDAVTRGLKVGLVERDDFGSGTSGKSSKLIHGGLRYLKQFQLKVTWQSSREKTILRRLAPHLVEDIPFVLPYRGWMAGRMIGAGLAIYDSAAGSPEELSHRRLGAEETLERLPGLDPRGLRGSYLYFDARADDCRLVIHVAKKASDLGASLANGVEVTGFVHEAGRIKRVRTRDFEIVADRVVNATGVWCDGLRGLDDAQAAPLVRPSKGAHLVVPAARLGLKGAAMLPSLEDDRVVFLIPTGDRLVVGTTDTEYRGPLEAPRAQEEDIAYLLGLVNRHLPGAGLARKDVGSTYAGLRPLLLGADGAPSKATRDHRIVESASGLLTVTGGKLTTYRLMAEEVVDRITDRPCMTAGLDLFGTVGRDALSRAYGTEAVRITDRTPLEGDHVWGEVDYVVEQEMARTLSDVLVRRLRLALYAPDRGLSVAPQVAERMARILGWGPEEAGRQVESFRRELESHFPRG